MNAYTESFNAKPLTEYLKDTLPQFQIDWLSTVRIPSIMDADCIVIIKAETGVEFKIKQQIAKIFYDEVGSFTLAPLPGADPADIQVIRTALLNFHRGEA